ncbi:MAG: hypothetical protein Q8Q85_14520 [Gemmatimonadales bacterium]|nr:hypothetical protein [Gemmatimonadales bacterium]
MATAVLDWLRILVGREPPDTRYARLHRRMVRKACRLALRGEADWLSAVAVRGAPELDERVVELPWVYGKLAKRPGGRLLDVGSTLNTPFHIEQLRGRFAEIAFLNPYPDDGYRSAVPGVSYVPRDARDPGLLAASFGQVTCISTLEHVGCDNTLYGALPQPAAGAAETNEARAAAMRALRTLVAPGGSLLLTVPYGRYEDHGWFVQLDAPSLDEAIEAFAPLASDVTYFLHDARWRRARADECAAARYGERTRGGSAVACVELRV